MAANTNGHEVVDEEEETEPQSPRLNALPVSDEDSVSRSVINQVHGNYYEHISGGDDARYINGTYNDPRPAALDSVTGEKSPWQAPLICLGLALFAAVVVWAHHIHST